LINPAFCLYKAFALPKTANIRYQLVASQKCIILPEYMTQLQKSTAKAKVTAIFLVKKRFIIFFNIIPNSNLN